MRRSVFFLLILAGLVPAISWLTADLRPVPDLLDLLPLDAQLVVDWIRPQESWDRFQSKRAGRSDADGPNTASVLKSLNLARPEIGSLLARVTASCRQETAAACKDLLRRRLVLALLPEHGAQVGLPERLVLLVRLDARRFLGQLFPGQRQEVRKYQDATIYRNTWPDGQELYAAQCGKITLMSISRNTLQRCLWRYRETRVRPETGFGEWKQGVVRRYGGPGLEDLVLYAKGSLLTGLAASRVLAATPIWQGILDWLARLEISEVILCHRFWQETGHSTLVVSLPDRAVSADRGGRAPALNARFMSMPADLLFYFWTNLFDLQQVVRVAGRAGRAGGIAHRIGSWIGRRTGLTWEEGVRLFGSRFGCNIAAMHSENPLPVPRLCLCLEVRDREKIARALEKILVGVPVRHDKIGKTEIVSVLAAEGLLQPTYALLDNYLILADSREQVEAVLADSRQRLLDSPDFQRVNTGFLQPSNMLTFVRPAELVKGIRSLLLWTEPFLALQDTKRAAASRKVLEERVLPFLGELETLAAASFRFYTEPGRLVVKTALRSR